MYVVLVMLSLAASTTQPGLTHDDVVVLLLAPLAEKQLGTRATPLLRNHDVARHSGVRSLYRCCLEENRPEHDRVVCPTDTGQLVVVSVAMADASATPEQCPDCILRPHFGYNLCHGSLYRLT